jgi:AcrR family transcriptional regulator
MVASELEPDRRTRRRLATRQAISDAATRLFFEKGFDQVTIDEIAAAADVGRMTVFNHFQRKEDMFFDQVDAARDVVLDAIRTRPAGVSPLAALQQLAHRLIEENSRHLRFFEGSRLFVETVAASEPLKARARAIRDDAARAIAGELAAAAGRPADDADAELGAHFALAVWSVALLQAHAVYRENSDEAGAKTRFLAVIDRGMTGVLSALAGTPYVA